MRSPRRDWLGAILASLPLALGAIGLLLHLTVRDRVYILSPLFYGLAPAVLVVIFALSLVLCLRLRRKRRAILSLIAVVIALALWIHTDYVRGKPHEGNAVGRPMRLVMWNLARPSGRDERFLSTLQDSNADILVLVESGRASERRRRFWQTHFSDYHVALLERDITVLSRYPIVDTAVHVIGRYTRIAVCDLEAPFAAMSVLAVDIDSNVFISRKPAIDRIYEIARSKPGPVAILGDFNTPHTSAFFADLYSSFQHAFQQSGDGWITTWPTFCPALTLDHIWLSDDFVVARTVTRRQACSDHVLVMTDVLLPDPQNEPDRAEVSAL